MNLLKAFDSIPQTFLLQKCMLTVSQNTSLYSFINIWNDENKMLEWVTLIFFKSYFQVYRKDLYWDSLIDLFSVEKNSELLNFANDNTDCATENTI